MGGGSGRFVSCHYETSHSKFDISKEHGFQREGELTPHLWQLLTLAWDCAAPQVDDCGELLINAGLTASDLGSTDDYVGDGHDNDPMSFSDITLDDVNGRHLLTLGRSQPGQDTAIRMWTCSGAIATFDELALYDFGGADPAGIPAEPATLNSPGVLASNRFKEGRYYRESAYTGLFASSGMNRAGEYFSPLIRLGGTFRIKALAWTQVVPQELPNAGIRFELVDAPGADYLPDASGRPIDRTFDLSRGSTVSRRVGTPFRLHAVFQPNLDPATLQDTPILNPLALDDVTVIYEPVGGRRILDWYAP